VDGLDQFTRENSESHVNGQRREKLQEENVVHSVYLVLMTNVQRAIRNADLLERRSKSQRRTVANGDFTLVESPELSVHVRQSKWFLASVNTKVGFKTSHFGNKVVIKARDYISIDGKVVRLDVGKSQKVQNGGSVKRLSKSSYRVKSLDKSYAIVTVNTQPFPGAWQQSHYIDLMIYMADIKNGKGLCFGRRQVIPAAGIFARQSKLESLPKPIFSKKDTKKATKKCLGAGINPKYLKMCVFDEISTKFQLPARKIVRFNKRCKKERTRVVKRR